MIFPLKAIPEELWTKAKHVAVDQKISMRILIFRAIKMYINANPLLSDSQFDRVVDCTEAKQMAKDAIGALK